MTPSFSFALNDVHWGLLGPFSRKEPPQPDPPPLESCGWPISHKCSSFSLPLTVQTTARNHRPHLPLFFCQLPEAFPNSARRFFFCPPRLLTSLTELFLPRRFFFPPLNGNRCCPDPPRRHPGSPDLSTNFRLLFSCKGTPDFSPPGLPPPPKSTRYPSNPPPWKCPSPLPCTIMEYVSPRGPPPFTSLT